ncbi:PP2C family protein-serine/threonine phosphatase [Paenibacillus pasadenensis]|uniref:Serine phosphatase RsbU, regulator of sigma subunit n=1 Tax=Paenibacillus pasadenensis TaxID=217090 RepID=A0A2N5NAL9_9BACL|nr:MULTISPECIES: fused response regulator/phosphatase [Paenibacillus]PLT47396.1 Serine phosphatase RsbU, regulator of sigma subunit [Paenibacillus pasadenensis]QGG57672.1 SpoIIE family protein phosphatase [Paenibacillus sp. B01]
MRIVVVDDNAMNITVVQEMLKRAGYWDVRAAASGMELFAMLGLEENGAEPAEGIPTPDVDLILLDMMMPRIDGIAACQAIQASERLRDIPVIMVTAIGDSKKLAEALDAGAIDYVTKPINRIELLARIRVALRLKQEKDWHRERDRRIREELQLAKEVQSAALPPKLEESGIVIDAIYQPSEELSGDLYAWNRIDEHRYGIAVIDAMGHGISSSLVCMFIASVLRDAMVTKVEPVLVMEELNRRALQLQFADQLIQYYFTALYMVVDLQRGTVEYVNAGHPPGLLVRAGGQGTEEPLSGGGMAVGLFEGVTFQKQVVEVQPGDQLLLFTDGLLELVSGPEEGRLEMLMERMAGAVRTSGSLHELLLSEDGPRPDDCCLVQIGIR